jgi:protein SCO1
VTQSPDADSSERRPIRWRWPLVAMLLVIGIWLALVFSPIGADFRAQIASWVQADPVLGGPFALIDQTGQTVTDRDLAGKPFALFFGFTHCPDVCPTTLTDMAAWLDGLGPDAANIRFAMVTVDPERDTQAVLASYMSAFDKRILALTGSRADIDKTIQAYRVYARKVDQGGGDYTMDHSAAVYLMDANGRYWSVISRGETLDGAVAKLRKLIHGA